MENHTPLPRRVFCCTHQGGQIPALPVVIGESGAKDSGDNGVNNTDTTMYLAADRVWLEGVAAYLRALSERTGRQPSWFFWAWNANSGVWGRGSGAITSQVPCVESTGVRCL